MNQEKLQAWLDDPNTDPDAWKYTSYRDIAAQTGLSYSAVQQHLLVVVAKHQGKSVAAVASEREHDAYEKGNRAKRIPADTKEMMEYLRFVKKKRLVDISRELNVGYGTVWNHFNRLKQQEKL